MRRHTQELYDILKNGRFLSENSTYEKNRQIYDDVTVNYEEYYDYFKEIGYELEKGRGYYYFTRKEKKPVIENKLKRFMDMIDTVDFLREYDPAFGQGMKFTKTSIMAKIEGNLSLKDKIRKIGEEKKSNEEKIEIIIKGLEDKGVIETMETDSKDREHIVMAAFDYIETMITELKELIPEEEQK